VGCDVVTITIDSQDNIKAGLLKTEGHSSGPGEEVDGYRAILRKLAFHFPLHWLSFANIFAHRDRDRQSHMLHTLD
jgi:hypothetical protein